MSSSGEWEYKIVHTTDGGLFNGDTPPMEDAPNSFDGDGWELMNTIADSRGANANNGQTAFMFRRPER